MHRPIPLGWSTYTSEQYGYIIGYPPDWSVDPADRAYDVDRDAADWLSPAMDDFTAQTGDVRMSVWAVPADQDTFETPTGVETWIEQFCEKTGNASCGTFLDGAVPLCIEVRDCHPGLLLGVAPPFDQEVQAFFTGGIYNSQMVVVTIWRAADDPSLAPYGGGRQLMEAILMTMCVVPEEGHESRRFNCG